MSSSSDTNKILIAAILNSYRPLRDKSFSINIVINEPNAEQKVIIDRLFQQACYVLIKSGEIQQEEQDLIDNIDADISNKTPSQRFRNVLYRNWEQNNKGFEKFKDYYSHQMDEIINHYKSKLD